MAFNLLDILYRKLWVPLFGRILYLFVSLIEGRKSNKKPTYSINNNQLDINESKKN